MEQQRKIWSKELIIQAIRDRHTKGESVVSGKVYLSDERLHKAARRKFGSWNEALIAAGLDTFVTFEYPKKWTHETVRRAIQQLHSEGKSLKPRDVEIEHGGLYKAGRRRFGSWREALLASGVEVDNKLCRSWTHWTPEIIIQEIRERHSNGSSINSYDVYRTERRLYVASQKLFGSWNEALKASGFREFIKERQRNWTNKKVINDIQDRHSK
ncbi:hypothetical protein [Alicyclobacillus fodiniaquatilis]|uniref:Uncharacterized protein n=1 Tax=Alicyclobacillus fodiniaquatilis TaxID=1661150 RepID=A0ABW4JI54_9BACL